MDKITYFAKLGLSSDDALFGVKAALVRFMRDKGFYFKVDDNLEKIFQCFTINNIISLWAQENVELITERKYSLNDEDLALIKGALSDKKLVMTTDDSSIIGRVYEKTISASEKKSGGITYTPDDLCEYISEMVKEKICENSRFLDPACGCGVLLETLYERLMGYRFTKDSETKVSQVHSEILKRNIFGFDSSPEACAIAKVVLALKYNKFVECKNIVCIDSLTALPKKFDEKFDFVISNPPYVGHKSMNGEYRKKLYEIYRPVYYDKADMSYCFFMLGHRLLKKDGTLIYITGRYFAQSKFAQGLRGYILDNFSVKKIIDFYGVRPFKNAGVDPLIIELKKGKGEGGDVTAARFKNDCASSRAIMNDDNIEIMRISSQDLTKEGFNYLSVEQKRLREAINRVGFITLGEMGSFFQGIITGCDKAFVLREGENDKAVLECGRQWIKGSEISKGEVFYSGKWLLYTNGIENTDACPVTMEHLKKFETMLMKRRECQRGSRRWYELQWGRKESLFKNKKLIFPYKSESSRFAVDDRGYFFSADVYGFVLKDEFKDVLPYEKLALILNSKPYEDYFKSFAKKLGGRLYEYYPNTLQKILLPRPEVIRGFEKEEDILEFLAEK